MNMCSLCTSALFHLSMHLRWRPWLLLESNRYLFIYLLKRCYDKQEMIKLHDVLIDDLWWMEKASMSNNIIFVLHRSRLIQPFDLIWFGKRRNPLMRASAERCFAQKKYFCAQGTQLLRGDTNQVKIVSGFARIKTKNYFKNHVQAPIK